MAFASRFRHAAGWRTLAHTAVILLAALSAQAATPQETAATLVLFNRTDPDSATLAAYYADRRGIPADRVIGLTCPTTEEISRAEFESTIARPLRGLFQTRGWWTILANRDGRDVVRLTKIRFLAIVRGIPLKIAPDPTVPAIPPIPDLPPVIAARNEASVDSELAAMGLENAASPAGITVNPYYRGNQPILRSAVDAGLLLPTRLDGPTPQIVKSMIDDTMTAEREGLWGWAYVDARGIESGHYAEGDRWLLAAAKSMRALGIPVQLEKTEGTLPAGYPVTDAAVYYGWYAGSINGPFAEPGFRFRPGAIAAHIHSFSAATLRSTTSGWCGPLVAHGAAATLGNVYEPYLALTASIEIFQDRLMAGLTLAESAYMAQRAVSWMGVVVGDPLYRPYSAWMDLCPPSTHVPNQWEVYRRIIREHNGNVLLAANALRQAASQSSGSLFLEALAAAQSDAGEAHSALESLQTALKRPTDPDAEARLHLECLAALRTLGESGEMATTAQSLAKQIPSGARRELFLQYATPRAPAPTPIHP